jgi:hypothetical protein
MNGTMPGYGDEETWPPCVGHPNDPRSEDEDEDETESDSFDPARPDNV